MILSDRDIKKAIKTGDIVVAPQPNYTLQLSSCSLDLHLGNEFSTYQSVHIPFIDLKKKLPPQLIRRHTIKDDEYFIVSPNDFILGITEEYIELSDSIAGRLEGRSSLGRLGIIVHSTAALFHAGFKGHPVLELGNLGKIPVALYPKMSICHFSFETLSSPSETPYHKNKRSKYAYQTRPDIRI